jgi:hypothetical protein
MVLSAATQREREREREIEREIEMRRETERETETETETHKPRSILEIEANAALHRIAVGYLIIDTP